MPLQYQPLARLLHPEGHSDGVSTVCFSPNGLLLASGGMDGRVCVWSMCSNKLLYVFSGRSPVLSLAWLAASNDKLVCGMEDGTIASLTLATDVIRLNGFLAHRFPVERLAICGTQLASGAHKEVKVWARTANGDFKDPTLSGFWAQTLELDAPPRSSYTSGREVRVTSLHWTAAPKCPSVLIVTYLSHGIVAYDARTWNRIRATPVPGYIADASLSTDGKFLVTSNMLTGFELFHMKAPAEVEPLFSFKQDVTARRPIPVRFVHGDHAIIGGTSHSQVNVWDVVSRLKQSLHLSSE
ncbi:WD40 repeat-like protein [Polyporus arcularius HHB13444]|uniref:WD40 repeat-like protein n=1 Tax=Polyporus arcularius HHB13444 TaxID=1314778 RepID=A0A5C3PB36_9APHY|nr:WD40 repeat-like protein [Polyporus arcularius HHB13444]